MWNTSMGVRVLEPAEATFYLRCLELAAGDIAMYEDFDDDSTTLWRTGDRIFDHASVAQRLVLLNECLAALINPEIPPPELTTVREAAAYAPFAFLDLWLKEELEGVSIEPPYSCREILLQAFRELELPEVLEELAQPLEESEMGGHRILRQLLDLEVTSKNPELWQAIAERLKDRIFWDRDWVIPSRFPAFFDGMEEYIGDSLGLDDSLIVNGLPPATPEQGDEAHNAILSAVERLGQI